MRSPRAGWLLVASLVVLGAAPALAVRPQTWQIDQPQEFLAGTLESVTLSSHAELLLSPRSQRYEFDNREADTVNTLVIGPNDIPYAGTGPNGIIYRLVDNVPQRFADVPEGQVFSLLFLPDGSLLAGTGGRRGVIYRISPDGERSLFWQAPSPRYVWAMARDAAGTIYAATGSGGEIYKIAPDGKDSTVLVSLRTTKNVLALAMTDEDRLVFGTDGNGLVGAVDTDSGQARILFDAGPRSVSAIVALPDGAVYVTTTQPDKSAGNTGGPIPSRPQGRPEPLNDRNGDEEPDSEDSSATQPAVLGNATLPSPQGDRAGGSTIYRIDPTGLTTELLSLPVMFLSMIPTNGDLVIGTGLPGRVYLVEPGSERYIALLRDDTAFFSAAGRAGNMYWVGTSRPASLVRVVPSYTSEGAFTSGPQDASQIALWGKLRGDATLPPGTSVTVQTRSSNLREPTDPGWSDWSEPVELTAEGEVQISSPPGRFLQVRLILKASEDGKSTPVVRSLTIPYMTRNLAPEIDALSVTVPVMSDDKRNNGWYNAESELPVVWQARDPNGDALVYQVDLRPVGSRRWIRIAKEITNASYTLNSRTVPDGRYEVRITASDSPDNPPAIALMKTRISEAFTVDNTPPRIENLRATPTGQNSFRIQAKLVDEANNIIAAQYAVDSAETWVSLLPADDIFDSPAETVGFAVSSLAPGEHILTLRAADSYGNTAHAWLTLTVE